MKLKGKARHTGTGKGHSHKDTNNSRPWNNTGRWKLLINISTRETTVTPVNSEAFNFPGSQWDEVYFGSYRECLVEQMRLEKTPDNARMD